MVLFFAAVISIVPSKWQEEADMQDISDTFSKDIMDDIMLYALLLVVLLKYLEVVLEILSHYKCNLKPNKTRFNGPSQEFVWVDMRNEEKTPAESNQASFKKMDALTTLEDLSMVIRMFGLYRPWIPFYKV